MTLFEMYSYLNALINTESLGGDLNLKEFQYLIADENLNMFKSKVEELYTNQRAGALTLDKVYASKMLRTFITEGVVVPSSGTISLASLSSYAYFISMYTTGAYLGQVRNIPLVTNEVFTNQLTNILAKPLKKYPVCIISGDSLKIKPNNIISVTIYYFRYPLTPVMDYYIDANDNVMPLTAGSTHVLLAGETGSSGQTSGTVTSSTVELEFTHELHPEFVNRLMGKLGIPKRDQALIQTSIITKQQEESK